LSPLASNSHESLAHGLFCPFHSDRNHVFIYEGLIRSKTVMRKKRKMRKEKEPLGSIVCMLKTVAASKYG
jgi:hypothetical protein